MIITFCFFLLQDNLGLKEDTYELSYNSACALIGQQQYSAALEKLKQAEGCEYNPFCLSDSFIS